MYKIFDFQCHNKDCSKYNKVEELVIVIDEIPICESCMCSLSRLISATKSSILGTDNNNLVR